MSKPISDMYFAAAVLSLGAKLEKVDRTERKRQRFIFNDAIQYMIVFENEEEVQLKRIDAPTIDDVEQAYITRRLWFPPSYTDAIRQIKAAIHI